MQGSFIRCNKKKFFSLKMKKMEHQRFNFLMQINSKNLKNLQKNIKNYKIKEKKKIIQNQYL